MHHKDVIDSARPLRASAMNAAPARFPLYDSIRALAALSIFGTHVAIYLHAYLARRGGLEGLGPVDWVVARFADPFLARANGFAIFMIISGFLLYRPFARARLERTPPPAAGPYAARRFLRVAPPYWTVLVLVALWFGWWEVFTPEGVVTYFGFLQVFQAEKVTTALGQIWVVCVLVQFYAAMPLLAHLLRRVPFGSTRGFVASELRVLAVLFAAAVAWKLLFFLPLGNGLGALLRLVAPLYWLPAYLDYFALGMALAVASVVLAGRERQPAAVRLISAAPWLPWLLAAVAFYLTGVGGGNLRSTSAGQFTAMFELEGLVAALLVVPVVFGDQGRGLLRRLLANRVLLWIGVVSYGFFLWHMAVLQQFAALRWDLALGPFWFCALALLASLALGAATFYGLERPLLRWRRRLSRPSGSGAAVGGAAANVPVRSGGSA
jgi:peptidoglycan/LPS O-acetylase OafA/YrhL